MGMEGVDSPPGFKPLTITIYAPVSGTVPFIQYKTVQILVGGENRESGTTHLFSQ